MSVDTVLKIAKTITTILLRMPLNGSMLSRTMLPTPEHKSLKPLLDHFDVYGDALTKSGNGVARHYDEKTGAPPEKVAPRFYAG